jgi:hypothetical protein
MTWPPQSPDLNPIEMVWDELDSRVENQHMLNICGNSFKSVGKAHLMKLVERMPSVCSLKRLNKTNYYSKCLFSAK